jgi:two-component system, oxyanion-binding sensor
MRLVHNGRKLTIGLLKLTDAAPVIMAKELGLFARENVDVALSIEPSWATLADKLAYGFVDAGVMLAPLVLATNIGLRGAPRPLIVPMNLSLGGNTVTLSPRWTERRGAAKPTLAVVHAFSSHNFLLRYWLAARGIDPDRDVSVTVIPPAGVVDALREERIDGFCAGAPWGEMACRDGLATTVATSHDIWRNGPEKVFAVRRDWAENNPEILQSMLRALLDAARFCDAPENGATIAATLARSDYLDMPEDLLRASLPPAPAASRFFAHAATFPWHSHALWFLQQMVRWGYLAAEADCAGVAAAAYRPDLYASAAREIGIPVPRTTSKREGDHDGPWSLAATPTSIAMDADLFCDGSAFDPAVMRCTQIAQAVPKL